MEQELIWEDQKRVQWKIKSSLWGIIFTNKRKDKESGIWQNFQNRILREKKKKGFM